MDQPKGDRPLGRYVSAATEAALFAMANKTCYWPGCTVLVVDEVRPGVYQKNVEIAHIFAVKSGAPRFRECRTKEEVLERDSFRHLLLLCTKHHSEIDNKFYGEERYPPELLMQWKREHEGKHGPALATIGPISEELLAEALLSVFTPPLDRLESIADQLEQTGTLTSDSLGELRNIIEILRNDPGGPDSYVAESLAHSADVFASINLANAASQLQDASDVFSGLVYDLQAATNPEVLASLLDQLRGANDPLSALLADLQRKINELRDLGGMM